MPAVFIKLIRWERGERRCEGHDKLAQFIDSTGNWVPSRKFVREGLTSDQKSNFLLKWPYISYDSFWELAEIRVGAQLSISAELLTNCVV